MRKVFINKWFFLAVSLTLGLSAISFASFKQTQSVCTAATTDCRNAPANTNQKTDMLWDLLSRQFSNFISIQ